MTDTARMQEALAQQLRLLRTACTGFDAGDEEQALTIATKLRVLFHQTRTSTSLVTHLGTAAPTTIHATKQHFGDWRDLLGLTIDISSATPIRVSPLRDRAVLEPVSIAEWWSRQPLLVHNATSIFRQRIILAVVNKDGGAHVDEELEEFYEALLSGVPLIGITGSLTYDRPAPFPQGQTIFPVDAHYSLLRQFGHEVLESATRDGWV
ncbi:hypothetical protein ACFV4K_00385 [Nocardia sp. NPDC059764]|uniref:hypothetical protein n=1 Tax=Nocardia sp. NPDC059764 TaxID=3346939 RepID=UPI00364CF9F4